MSVTSSGTSCRARRCRRRRLVGSHHSMPGRSGGRIVIVRYGATELYEHLKAKFASDELTIVIYDRRTATRRGGTRERRRRDEVEALVRRGFYVIRPIRSGHRK